MEQKDRTREFALKEQFRLRQEIKHETAIAEQSRDALESALLKFKGTVIAISHDRYFLNRCINRILEFSGSTAASFNGNYDAYRRKKTESQALKPVEKGRRNTSAGKTPNRPGRDTAGLQTGKKTDIRHIEARNTELERKRKELEDSFGIDTLPEKYVEYDGVIKELENLYELYVLEYFMLLQPVSF